MRLKTLQIKALVPDIVVSPFLKSFSTSPLYYILELFEFKPPIWVSYRNYDIINLIHLAATGDLKELIKQKG